MIGGRAFRKTVRGNVEMSVDVEGKQTNGKGRLSPTKLREMQRQERAGAGVGRRGAVVGGISPASGPLLLGVDVHDGAGDTDSAGTSTGTEGDEEEEGGSSRSGRSTERSHSESNTATETATATGTDRGSSGSTGSGSGSGREEDDFNVTGESWLSSRASGGGGGGGGGERELSSASIAVADALGAKLAQKGDRSGSGAEEAEDVDDDEEDGSSSVSSSMASTSTGATATTATATDTDTDADSVASSACTVPNEASKQLIAQKRISTTRRGAAVLTSTADFLEDRGLSTEDKRRISLDRRRAVAFVGNAEQDAQLQAVLSPGKQRMVAKRNKTTGKMEMVAVPAGSPKRLRPPDQRQVKIERKMRGFETEAEAEAELFRQKVAHEKQLVRRRRQLGVAAGRVPPDLAGVRALLEAGVSPNDPGALAGVEHDKAPPLVRAVVLGHTDVVSVLLEYGANLERPDMSGETALMKACAETTTRSNKRLGIVKLLLGKGAELETRNRQGWTALLLAINMADANVAELLLQAGADPHVSALAPEEHSFSGAREINSAAVDFARNRRIVEDPDTRNTILASLRRRGVETHAYRAGTLRDAVARNSDDAKAVLSAVKTSGCAVDAEDEWSLPDHRTPLTTACMRGHPQSAELLLEHGANIDLQDHKSWTALMWTIWSCGDDTANAELVSLLLARGADVALEAVTDDWANPETGRVVVSALTIAQNYIFDDAWRERIVSSLYAAGASNPDTSVAAKVSAPLQPGALAEAVACEPENLAAVKSAVEAGFGPDDEAEAHRLWGPPLVRAAVLGHLGVLQFLLSAPVGANVESRDRKGETALSKAVQAGNSRMVKLLLDEGGADINTTTDGSGQTPLLLALNLELSSVVSQLLEAGADVHVVDAFGHDAMYYAQKYPGRGEVNVKKVETYTTLIMQLRNYGIDEEEEQEQAPQMSLEEETAAAFMAGVSLAEFRTASAAAAEQRPGTAQERKILRSGGRSSGGSSPSRPRTGAQHGGEGAPEEEEGEEDGEEEEDASEPRTPREKYVKKRTPRGTHYEVVKVMSRKKKKWPPDTRKLKSEKILRRMEQLEQQAAEDEDERNDAAHLIQTAWRGHVSYANREKNAMAAEQAKIYHSASLLQASFRGHRSRKSTDTRFLLKPATAINLGGGDRSELRKALREETSVNAKTADKAEALVTSQLLQRVSAQRTAAEGHTRATAQALERRALKQLMKQKMRGGDRGALRDAVARGREDAAAVLAATQAGRLPDEYSERSSGGTPPLIKAAELGYAKVTAVLLENGAMIEAVDRSGETALLTAAQFGQPKVLAVLLSSGANIEARNRGGMSALMLAANLCDEEIVQLLLGWTHGDVVGADPDATDHLGQSALSIVRANIEVERRQIAAITKKHQSFSRQLKSQGVGVFEKRDGEVKKQIAAIEESKIRHQDIVSELLHYGAHEHSCPQYERSASASRASSGASLSSATSVELRGKYVPGVLAAALESGDYDAALECLRAGADCASTQEHCGERKELALHHVVRNGQLSLLELLGQFGANVEAVGTGGRTALHVAAESGQKEMLEALLTNGANDSALTAQGYTALELSKALPTTTGPMEEQRRETLQVWQQYFGMGAYLPGDLRAAVGVVPEDLPAVTAALDVGGEGVLNHPDFECDDSGNTVLMAACKLGHLSTVALLLERGADGRAFNNLGQSAFHFALEYVADGAAREMIVASLSAYTTSADGGGAAVEKSVVWSFGGPHNASYNEDGVSAYVTMPSNAGAAAGGRSVGALREEHIVSSGRGREGRRQQRRDIALAARLSKGQPLKDDYLVVGKSFAKKPGNERQQLRSEQQRMAGGARAPLKVEGTDLILCTACFDCPCFCS